MKPDSLEHWNRVKRKASKAYPKPMGSKRPVCPGQEAAGGFASESLARSEQATLQTTWCSNCCVPLTPASMGATWGYTQTRHTQLVFLFWRGGSSTGAIDLNLIHMVALTLLPLTGFPSDSCFSTSVLALCGSIQGQADCYPTRAE